MFLSLICKGASPLFEAQVEREEISQTQVESFLWNVLETSNFQIHHFQLAINRETYFTSSSHNQFFIAWGIFLFAGRSAYKDEEM
jgi:hypothetical protein